MGFIERGLQVPSLWRPEIPIQKGSKRICYRKGSSEENVVERPDVELLTNSYANESGRAPCDGFVDSYTISREKRQQPTFVPKQMSIRACCNGSVPSHC